MPQCAFHPKVETNVRCAECGRYICTRDMVTTPVGYKCRECARPAASARRYVKPRQYTWAALTALAVGVGGGLLLAFIGVGGMFLYFGGLLFGLAEGALVRRASGGHRTSGVAALAGAGAFMGGLLAFGLLGALIAAVVAAVSVSGGRA